MIFATPPLSDAAEAQLRELDSARRKLGEEASTFSPWLGTLRRAIKAKTVESSVSIEGFDVDDGEAVALIDGAVGSDDDESRLAFSCYARAMDHVGVLATDPVFTWSDRVILDLHFDATSFQRDKSPGLWRQGPILVTERGGGVAYRGPDADDVPGLMREVVAWLEGEDHDHHPVVRGAMAHLNVVSVHPFRDGNGRISRIVQSLVLAREGLVSPELGSIEEYLADHTPEYYSVLREVQGGGYKPDRDATPWVEFCLHAHAVQVHQRLEQLQQAGVRWALLEQLVAERGWPERLVIALEGSLAGGTDSATYRNQAEVSPPTASADFRRLLDAGLAIQRGKGRSTRYVASDQLKDLVAPEQ